MTRLILEIITMTLSITLGAEGGFTLVGESVLIGGPNRSLN